MNKTQKPKTNKKKLCKITNGEFSWIMEVDGEYILFQGSYNAQYFEKHYKSLAYKVEVIN